MAINFIGSSLGTWMLRVTGYMLSLIHISVYKIDYNKQTVTINVELFGRDTPVEISFSEVRKLD